MVSGGMSKSCDTHVELAGGHSLLDDTDHLLNIGEQESYDDEDHDRACYCPESKSGANQYTNQLVSNLTHLASEPSMDGMSTKFMPGGMLFSLSQ